MDVRQFCSRVIATIALLVVLTGCETQTSADALQIIGNPPSEVYYGNYFEFEFGVSGGQGPYSYRYVRNPKNGSENADENYHEFQIREGDTPAKPSFILSGIPRLRDGMSFDDAVDTTYQYGIEVRDNTTGIVVSEVFEFTVKKIKLKFSDDSLRATEGAVLTRGADRLQSSLNTELNFRFICDTEIGKTYDERILGNGITVQPNTYFVSMDRPLVEPITIGYRVVSSYSESSPASDRRNIGHARPNVDFVAEDRVLRFEAGEQACLIVVDMIDDGLVEGDEQARVEFYVIEGGLVDVQNANASITFRDNEPDVVIDQADATINSGEELAVPLLIDRAHPTPVNVIFSVDVEGSRIDNNVYAFTPESGVATIEEGDQDGVLTVSTEPLSGQPTGKDDFIYLVSNFDALNGRDPIKVGINNWGIGNHSLEIVAEQANNEAALDIALSDERVFVLIEKQNDTGRSTLVRAFDHYSNAQSMTSTAAEVEIAMSGFDITPLAVWHLPDNDELLIFVQTDTRLRVGTMQASRHNGGLDFALITLVKQDDSSEYLLQSVKQFGTELDDLVNGVELDSSGNIYIYGETEGSIFDGEPGAEGKVGAKDGFVYALNAQGSKKWAKFVGTASDDRVVSLDVSRSRLLVGLERTTADTDVLLVQLAVNDGDRIEGVEDYIFGSTANEFLGGGRFGPALSSGYLAVNSNFSVLSSGPTPSATQDVHVLKFDLDSNLSAVDVVSSSGHDESVALMALKESDGFVVLGTTMGELPFNTAIGGQDVFVTKLISDTVTNSVSIDRSLQFGTPGNDEAIAIREHTDRKFYVLWSEDYSGTAGGLRYRVSAFSTEANKLSVSP